MKKKTKPILLQDFPSPSQDDIIEVIRHIRAINISHKMYPKGHQMIIKTFERLHNHLKAFLKKAPKVVMMVSGDVIEVNGEKIFRQSQEQEHSKEIAHHFKKQELQTLVFEKGINLDDLIEFFGHFFHHNPEQHGPMLRGTDKYQFPTLKTNQVVVNRASGGKIRDRLSIEELVSSLDRNALLQELGLDPDNLPPEIQAQIEAAEKERKRREREERIKNGDLDITTGDAIDPAEARRIEDAQRQANARGLEDVFKYDPDEIRTGFPAYVTSGKFLNDLFGAFPSSDRTPAITPNHQMESEVIDLGQAEIVPSPMAATEEFDKFSLDYFNENQHPLDPFPSSPGGQQDLFNQGFQEEDMTMAGMGPAHMSSGFEDDVTIGGHGAPLPDLMNRTFEDDVTIGGHGQKLPDFLNSPIASQPVFEEEAATFMGTSNLLNQPVDASAFIEDATAFTSGSASLGNVYSDTSLDSLKDYFAGDGAPEPEPLSGDGHFSDPTSRAMMQAQVKQHLQQSLSQLSGTYNGGGRTSGAKKSSQHNVLQQQITQQINSLLPSLIGEYLLNLSKDNPVESELRASLLQDMTPEKMRTSQESLLESLEEQHTGPQQRHETVQLLEDMIDQQIQVGSIEDLTHLISKIEQKEEDNQSDLLKQSADQLKTHIAQPENISPLIEQATQIQRHDARSLLSKLAPQSLPQCVDEYMESTNYAERQKRAQLVVELLEHATLAKREATLEELLSRLEDPNTTSEQRDMILELCRGYSPSKFEEYIINRLTQAESNEERSQLVRQAITHDSPRMVALCVQLLKNRIMADSSEDEEFLLRYLQSKNKVDPVSFLDVSIHHQNQDVGLRNSAVWMLGAFPVPKSLQILQKIVSGENHQESETEYTEDIRFQALHTLTRFPLPQTRNILVDAQYDKSLLVQVYAKKLLAKLDENPMTASQEELYAV